MFIQPCPRCGRIPKIVECVSYRKPDARRRLIECPNLCSVLTNTHKYEFPTTWYIEFFGDCDDNTMFKAWNEYLIEKK